MPDRYDAAGGRNALRQPAGQDHAAHRRTVTRVRLPTVKAKKRPTEKGRKAVCRCRMAALSSWLVVIPASLSMLLVFYIPSFYGDPYLGKKPPLLKVAQWPTNVAILAMLTAKLFGISGAVGRVIWYTFYFFAFASVLFHVTLYTTTFVATRLKIKRRSPRGDKLSPLAVTVVVDLGLAAGLWLLSSRLEASRAGLPAYAGIVGLVVYGLGGVAEAWFMDWAYDPDPPGLLAVFPLWTAIREVFSSTAIHFNEYYPQGHYSCVYDNWWVYGKSYVTLVISLARVAGICLAIFSLAL